MFTTLGLKYAALVFIAVVGVLQAAAGYNDLRGLLFFRRSRDAYIFAIIAIGVPLGIFFTWDYLFDIGVVQGSQQAGLFFFTVVAAVIFTVLLSSLINIKFYAPEASRLNGLDALREGALIRTLWERINGKH